VGALTSCFAYGYPIHWWSLVRQLNITQIQRLNIMKEYLLLTVLGVLVGLLITMIQLTTIGGVL
tara:strand:+ start:362 stop:553 length:192 start_codon:yes stop_codon:yes gene_type:complete